ncbi:unnamed protein product [Caenorhabditis angaria]|uniref:Anaphase-promoting complex subunit 2 n=1 Tax=Caenorhabditis angaria TaxID=860376 RepID=A0A9P1N3C5_9PELO|nr:unnamed protein product [Caenorhabditis angaria]
MEEDKKSQIASFRRKTRDASKICRQPGVIRELAGFYTDSRDDFLDFGRSKGVPEEELNGPTISELIFPISERRLISQLFKPFFMVHFAVWRVEQITDGQTFESGVKLDKSYYSQEKRREYWDYYRDYEVFSKELRKGSINIAGHLEEIALSLTKEISAGYIEHEWRTNNKELKCVWFQELINVMNSWSSMATGIDLSNILTYQICKGAIHQMTEHIYRIVVTEFPRKFRTIFTLRYCMQQTNNHARDHLTKYLLSEVEKYLLLASVDTKIILNAYASCVESLRELDSTCIIMHRICGIIKEYLKKRNDTVQQIISYITSDKKEELEKDLTNSKRSAMMDEDELKGVNDEFLPENMDPTGWYEWEPHPCDSVIGETAHGRQSIDVFNMLVSVYGSKELFVKEYRSLLAERMSNSDKKDPVFERRYLELLKLRFQYSELQHCDVMLRDVEHSQHVDQCVEKFTGLPVSGCIVSAHYWPKIEQEKVEDNYGVMPEALSNAMKIYARKYSEVREQRELCWLKDIGCVEIDLELDGVRIEKTIPNMYATVLYLLLEKESWTAPEVAEKLGLTTSHARRRLDWWRKQGLLTVGVMPGGTLELWSLTKNTNGLASNRAKSPEPIDEDEMAIDDSADIVESLEQYWGYTRNYISNHGANGEVKAERMHRVYRMFGSPTSGPTLDHVTTFLQRKVQLGLLTCSNGYYRVVQKQ